MSKKKKMMSLETRTCTILDYEKDNQSQFVNDAILDETLPVYTRELRVNALYLLDFITDGAKEWSGGKYDEETTEKDLILLCRDTLSGGIDWLRRKHHIRDNRVLEEVLSMFTSTQYGGAVLSELDKYTQELITRTCEKIEKIDDKYDAFPVGVGRTAKDVLDHWEALWDDDESYDIIRAAVSKEKPLRIMTGYRVIKTLQWIENTVIIEALKETEKK